MLGLDHSVTEIDYPPAFLKKLVKKLETLYDYPDSYTPIKKAIASYVGLKPENIVVGNGSDDLIDVITRAYGFRVLIKTPTFSQYELAARRRNSKITFTTSFSDSQIRNSTLIWVCNPNNPTGELISRDDILTIVKKTHAMVVVDEAYFEYTGKTVADIASSFSNLIVLRTFSKGLGLAGLRLGFAATNPSCARTLISLIQPYSLNSLAAYAGELILTEYLSAFRKSIRKTIQTREWFKQELRSLGYEVPDSFTSFVLVKFQSGKQARKKQEELESRGIAVLLGDSPEFTGFDQSFMRIGIRSQKQMEKVLRVFK